VTTEPSGESPAGALITAARSVVEEHGDGVVHTVAAAVLDEFGRIHVGLNLHHFTGGPCAELVALATARTAGARDPRLIVAVGDGGRGVLAPCGRDRQVLVDHHPSIEVVVPTPGGLVTVACADLLPHAYRWPAQPVQRLRFRASHLPAVRDGSKHLTLRSGDPVVVGPALLVFGSDDDVVLPGRITATTAVAVRDVPEEDARADGFTDAAAVLPGLRDYYPDLTADDEIVVVRFAVDD
jgi:cytidine deaminase